MCTTVIVGRLASTTGRVILGHNEDSGGRCMHQQFWVPGGSHSAQTPAATLMTVTSRTKKSVCSKEALGSSFAAA